MLKFKTVLIPFLLATGSFVSAQTKQDTMDYINREVWEAPDPADKRDHGFVVNNGDKTLYFRVEWDGTSGDEGDIQHHYRMLLPISNCDFYIKEDEFGYMLRARRRSGPKGIIVQTDNQEPISVRDINVVNGVNRPQMEKLLKAFNHLIELETGRKELF